MEGERWALLGTASLSSRSYAINSRATLYKPCNLEAAGLHYSMQILQRAFDARHGGVDDYPGCLAKETFDGRSLLSQHNGQSQAAMDGASRGMPPPIKGSLVTTYFPCHAGREMLIYQNKRLTCVKVSEEKGYEVRIYDCAREATAVVLALVSASKERR